MALLICSVTVLLLFHFPRPSLSAQQNNTHSNCDCSCRSYGSTELCSVQRLTPRLDCPCCQTCLRQAGEYCDEIAFPCDIEFGLSCSTKTETCEGPFDLRSVSVTHNSARLEWSKSANLQGHQLYIFYTSSYDGNLRQWAMQETTAGKSMDTIYGLERGTQYYIALVPESAGVFQFANRSEILTLKTQGCRQGNHSYAVGDVFSVGCDYNCSCTTEGLVACTERKCPLVYKKNDIKDPLCKEHDDPASDDPCCVIYTCQNAEASSSEMISSEHCLYKGQRYALATEFFNENCTSSCYCDEIGVVDCSPLKCPLSSPHLLNQKSCLEWSVNGSSSRTPPDCCSNLTCINDGTCKIDGTVYENGATVPTLACDQRCVCNAGKLACQSTCPEIFSRPPIDPSCPKFSLSKPPGSCCPEWKCDSAVRSSPAAECLLDGRPHRVGETWVDVDHCRSRNCTCRPGLNGQTELMCTGGCPILTNDDLNPRPGCAKPVVFRPDDPCACPNIRCSIDGADDVPIVRQNLLSNALYSLRATMVNETTAQTTLDISSELPRNIPAVLETHIAPVSIEGEGGNNSDTWTVSSTRIDRLQPVIIEFITGFQNNGTYRIRVRLILKDPATANDVVLPFSQTVFLTVLTKPNSLQCFINGTAFIEGAFIPTGCGQECICHNGFSLCRPTQCDVHQSVLLPSEFCPVPVLVKSPTECCPRWECHPSSTGCRLGSAIYSHGDHWRNGCSEECTCKHGSIQCYDLCEEFQKTLPHPSCKPTKVAGSCCPVWKCDEGITAPMLDFTNDVENGALNLSVTSIMSTKARLTWRTPSGPREISGFNLFVEETKSDRESYREANLIHPGVHEYALRDLTPGVRYKATLKALENDRIVTSHSIYFQTTELSDVKVSMWLGFIGSDKAEAVWDCQHCEDLTNLKLNLQSSSSPGPAIGDVTPGLPKITLTALNPKESYQLWLEGLTASGTAVKSNMLAFTTRADDEFNEIPTKGFQNQTAVQIANRITSAEQKLSTALIIVSALCGFFFLAFFMAIAVCLRYKKASSLQKPNTYHTYTDHMYK
ncbi:hypothetical protein RvY_09898-2 [Ramazzottius varieornatus]|uniref:Fibronectin type-III domain-containing protein n=1 Tax=Ramazzottius varieornatus TaxID=947166 RepID=A0A1D1VAY4_RAMVA|nr:hypothetical protein RvY_09898-2 [Ramazzottius varieornatus]